MRRLALLVAVAGALLAPATPAFAHGGETTEASSNYRTTITGISAPEEGLTVRLVEAGTRLELTNDTGHSVEILGQAGEPYLDVRPDGTYQNANSPADPTAPPAWQRVSTSTTVRWLDDRTHWLSSGPPPQAAVDPGREHRLREWVVPLRAQVRTFEIRGTLDWVPPPRAWLWWLTAVLIGLAATATAYRWSRSITPLALIGGLAPILYGWSSATDGAGISPVVVLAGLLALAAAYRHPPFYLTLSGAVLALFGGVTEIGAFTVAVLPAGAPAWLSRTAVAVALGVGAALCVTGIRRLRAAVPAPPPDKPGSSASGQSAGLSSSA